MDDLVTTQHAFARICARIRLAGAFGMDMEFQRETSYYPKLHLVQLSIEDASGEPDIVLVDPLAGLDLDPLYELVADPAVETVVHAGGQDVEIVHYFGKVIPAGVFDTQIAAGIAGFGEHPSYRTLVRSALGVRLTKAESRTEWSRRPLTPGQLTYARDDVVHLLPLRRKIGERLEQLGRTDWAAEEMAHYSERSTYERDAATLYLRLRRAATLDRRELAILRELCMWREQEAAGRDRPRGRVIADDVLVDLARRAPTSVEDLGVFRGLHPREIERSGEDVVRAVARAMELPRAEWPFAIRDDRDGDVSSVVDLLEIVVRATARDAGIARAYLGNRQDLAELVEHLRGKRSEPPAIWKGWRRHVVGDRLVRFATGRSLLGVDPATGKVHVVETE